MREIISIHVGQNGIDLGNVSWELFDMSHHIHPDYQRTFGSQVTSHQLDSFYKETADNQFIPRALCVGTTQEHVNAMKMTEVGMRLQDYQYITSNSQSNSPNSSYAYDYYTTSKEILDSLRRQIQKLSADCDNLDGFLIYQDISEGTTGLTSHLYDIINEDYAHANIFTFNIVSSLNQENLMDVSYSVLAMADNTQQSHLNVLFDSGAVSSIWQSLLNYDNPSEYHINQIIAQVIDSLTYSLRDQTYLTYDYSMQSIRDKLATRRLCNFAYSSYANFARAGDACTLPNSMSDLGKMLCLPDYSLIKYDSKLPYRILSNVMYFNGRSILPKDMKNCFYEWKAQQLSHFSGNCSVMTVKNHKSHSVIPGGDLEYLPKTVCSMSNSTLIGEYLGGLLNQFDGLFKKKDQVAKLYSKEGVESSDFEEARNCLNEVVEGYNDCFVVKTE